MIRRYLEDARKRYKITREKPQLWTFREQGFSYIQIPKVATRSIRAALVEMENIRSADESFAAFEQRFSSHTAHKELRRRVDGLKVFAFVRDPLVRLYSAYVNKIVDAERIGGRNIFRCHGMGYGMSFEAFVQRVSELDDRHIDRHLRSQAWFLTDDQGLIPDIIGRIETFADDWNRLREQFPCLGPVGHRNKTAGQADFRRLYSDRTLELVCQRYARDLQLFGYPGN
ncbi:sulfotransferase family protein [Pseudomonas sp. LABIM340]|uniref:sulfotransferase family protein n=1 Tax=Pseudomonas sp. LABIM340 TaxID=3156585 RepID=UPI0032AECE76